MFIVSKQAKQVLAAFVFVLGLLATGFSAPPAMDCTCDSPTVSITSQTSNSVAFSWGAVSGATSYEVWYVKREGGFTSQPVTTSGTTTSFNNLPAGTYKFYFKTVCGGEGSNISITEDLIMC
jgi:hypothetical protein